MEISDYFSISVVEAKGIIGVYQKQVLITKFDCKKSSKEILNIRKGTFFKMS